MITSCQIRAARALLKLNQKELSDLSGLSLPTIQRMEASKGIVKGNVATLVKLIKTFEDAGVELIAENAFCLGKGRGVRLIEPSQNRNEVK